VFFANTTSTVDAWPVLVSSITGHPGVVLVSFASLMAPRYVFSPFKVAVADHIYVVVVVVVVAGYMLSFVCA
jgi:hypothetical protein